MSLSAVIFDVDGTLADTEEIHRQSFNTAFREFGLPWEWDVGLYIELLAVAGGKERIRHYCRMVDPARLREPDIDELIASLHARKTVVYNQQVARGGLPARPGVLRLIRQLRDDGVRVAIATTTSMANVESLLRTTLKSLPPNTFEVIGAGEHATAKKPAPDIYRWVAERLRLRPEECLAIEDSRNGVLAASGAGMPVLVTVSPWSRGEDFTGSVAVLSDLGEPDRPYRPHRAIDGVSADTGFVDPVVLRRWHAQATTMAA